MNAESRLTYPSRFTGNERIVQLSGEAYFQVTKDHSHPFVVQTDGLQARVLGTELNVSHYLPKEIENVWHQKDMPEYNKTVVRLIARQQGIGGYDSWGAHCNDIYKNKTDKTYRLKFQIRF